MPRGGCDAREREAGAGRDIYPRQGRGTQLSNAANDVRAWQNLLTSRGTLTGAPLLPYSGLIKLLHRYEAEIHFFRPE